MSLGIAPRAVFERLFAGCTWCLEMVYDCEAYYTNCERHRVCHGCLRQVFMLATRDESMGIPRCCNHVLNVEGDPLLFCCL